MNSEQLSKLKELKELLDKGVLTKEEVEQEKKRILQSEDAPLPVQPSKQVEAEPQKQNRAESDKDAAKKRIVWICAAILLLLVCILMFISRRHSAKMAREYGTESDQVEDLFADSNDALDNHEWVDLGLPSGVKWATCNLGASSTWDSGPCFAWGEAFAKEEDQFSDDTYKLRKGRDFIKYNATDHLTQLSLSDDPAHMIWGDAWRMPTRTEYEELISCCRWEWVINGNQEDKAYRAVSKINGKSILFPAAGYQWTYDSEEVGFDEPVSFYWSSSLWHSDEYEQDAYAWAFSFYEPGNTVWDNGGNSKTIREGDVSMSFYERAIGAPIRAVMK